MRLRKESEHNDSDRCHTPGNVDDQDCDREGDTDQNAAVGGCAIDDRCGYNLNTDFVDTVPKAWPRSLLTDCRHPNAGLRV